MNRASAPSRPRAFTLMEVMLASALGAMLVVFCLAMFGAMDRAERVLHDRSTDAMEMATAHGALTRAFQNLLMSDEPDLGEGASDLAKKADVRSNDADRVEQFEPGAERARLAIQPDLGGPRMGQARPQTVFVALRTPPVYGGEEETVEGPSAGDLAPIADPEPNKREKMSDRRARERRERERLNPEATPQDESVAVSADMLPEGVRDAFNQAAGEAAAEGEGALGEEDPADASSADLEPARSVGVRGVFELLPDPPETAAERQRITDAGGEMPWALWWREVPPEASLGPGGRRIDTEPEETEVRRARLLRNLRTARWSVFRDGKFGPKMSAAFASHLPAYIQFQFETMTGRREDWVFEVAWATGPEPGTPMPAMRDQFNTGQTGDVGGNGTVTPTGGPTPNNLKQKNTQ